MSIESELEWLDEHPWVDRTGLTRALLTGDCPQSSLVKSLLPKRDKMKTKPRKPLLCSKCGEEIK